MLSKLYFIVVAIFDPLMNKLTQRSLFIVNLRMRINLESTQFPFMIRRAILSLVFAYLSYDSFECQSTKIIHKNGTFKSTANCINDVMPFSLKFLVMKFNTSEYV